MALSTLVACASGTDEGTGGQGNGAGGAGGSTASSTTASSSIASSSNSASSSSASSSSSSSSSTTTASTTTTSTSSTGTGGEGGAGGASSATTTAATTTASTTSASGSGGGPECNKPADCPSTACENATCVAGQCGLAPVGAGTSAGTQTPGDCKRSACDGAGNLTTVNDDTDLPDDGQACTDDTCENGVPTFDNEATGVACDAALGLVCDGNGACVECLSDGECLAATCVNGFCNSSCTDGQQNGTEAGVDCGGTCAACPQVVSTTPADAATGVAPDTSVSVTFNVPVDAASLTGQTAPGACSGSVQVSGDGFATCLGFATSAPALTNGNATATWALSPALSFGSTYDVRITNDVVDANGNRVTAYETATGFTTASGCGGTPTGGAGGLVISQLYGGGGQANAPFRNDFVELHNSSAAPISLGGKSVQYASSAGKSWNKVDLPNVTVDPGGYFLVSLASAGAVGAALPAPDATSTAINMSGTAGKLALVGSTKAFTTECPKSDASVLDFVGYGAAASCFEGSKPTPTPSPTTAVKRANNGCTDANDNATDFAVAAPAPRNAASPDVACSCATLNETGLPGELDFCVIQAPKGTVTVEAGETSEPIYGQVLEANVTAAAGAPAGLVAQVGYGPASVNPQSPSGGATWVFTPATYNAQAGDNDEFVAGIPAPATPGDYRFAYRFSLDGQSWTYCDLDGAGSNAGQSFETSELPTLTVTAPEPTTAASTTAASTTAASTTAATTAASTTGVGGATGAGGGGVGGVGGTATATTVTTAASTAETTVASTTATTATTDAASTSTGASTCTSASECSGATACATPTCVDGACGLSLVGAGQPATAQITGDCKVAQCDGNGNVVQVGDDADLPNDTRECTIDTCASGTPVFTAVPATPDTLCDEDGGAVCDGAGFCVECRDDADCSNEGCVSGECVPTCDDGAQNGDETGVDCGGATCEACAGTCTGSLVISQVYGAGGNSGAKYKADFVEIFNKTSVAVPLNGMSVQYQGASGTSWNSKVNLPNVTLEPGQYFLVQIGAAGTGSTPGAALPTPDASTTGFTMAVTDGKVALVSSTTSLPSGCPKTNAGIVDLVGYGAGANCFEGTDGTADTTATLAAIRDENGCSDTGDNLADFAAASANPRNTASPKSPCACQ